MKMLASVCILFGLTAVLAACEASGQWVKPGVSDADREKDSSACLFDSYDTIPSPQGPRKVPNQIRYRRCMSERGYTYTKAGE